MRFRALCCRKLGSAGEAAGGSGGGLPASSPAGLASALGPGATVAPSWTVRCNVANPHTAVALRMSPRVPPLPLRSGGSHALALDLCSASMRASESALFKMSRAGLVAT